jgi:hypothetical protein
LPEVVAQALLIIAMVALEALAIALIVAPKAVWRAIRRAAQGSPRVYGRGAPACRVGARRSGAMGAGSRRPPMHRRTNPIPRYLFAALFLAMELPVLAPLIVGAAVTRTLVALIDAGA